MVLPSEIVAPLAPLVASLRDVTTSYKHLLLRGLLARLAAGAGPHLAWGDLWRAMLEEAWWPAFHFRLSLGAQDQVVARLDALVGDPNAWRLHPTQVRAFIAALPFEARSERARGLLRYVPERLLAPWFGDDLAALPEAARGPRIAALSRERFEAAEPLYRVEADGVVVHPAWVARLAVWLPVVQGWSDAAWLASLEARNAHATSLGTKIRPAFERGSLSEERRIWREVALRGEVRCVFTDRPVNAGAFALDHFLPHAFTGHDRFWNLSPVEPGLNLRKSDRLPPERFVAGLARQHARLWRAVEGQGLGGVEPRLLGRRMDTYAADLGLATEGLASEAAMEAAYERVYAPLLGMARRMGFPDWDLHLTG